MTTGSNIQETLRRYWGYDTFRPKQEEIIRAILGGRDTAVVMPTGGGKSLCYQLPALAAENRMALVISPLIALMQDQVAQLEQMGVRSAYLNSAIDRQEQLQVTRAAISGQLRLLYLSPERLSREDTIEWLRRAPVGYFVIDEAHCISEWGHEFRPEYRQLSRLREHFPGVPIAAFTASATRHVRHDILRQLRLDNPATFIVSFFRSNLRYLVRQCSATQQERFLDTALRAYPEGSLIVYAPTIKTVESTAAMLTARGLPALAYHGQMDAARRKEAQERWMSDEVRLLVGTLAFGLGINKPNVRAVVHLSLPKSLEQYYQEAGRAGRDGEPADCALLWQSRDIGLLAHFIKQLEDPDEARRSWDRLREMRSFAEAAGCRHRLMCEHFGERPKWADCGTCDNCGSVPDWLDAAESSAAITTRVREKRPRAAPAPAPSRPTVTVNKELMADLKAWRASIARGRGIPAYTIFHDAHLIALCEHMPANEIELLETPGLGRRKVELYGQDLLTIIDLYR